MKITNLFNKKENVEKEELTLYKKDGSIEKITNELLVEHRIKVYVNEKEMMTLVCTGSYLPELVIGRLVSEGLINDIENIESIYICEEGLRAKVYLKNDKELRVDKVQGVEISSCCSDNVCFFKPGMEPDKITGAIKVEAKDVFKLAEEFGSDSKIHKMTSGTHAAYLYYKGEVVVSFEDIGRHNALDKAIGHIYLNNLNSKETMIFTTGRVPVDMIKKVIYAKIGALVSKAVPTVDAIKLAKQYNMNLICKAWPDSYEIYNESK